MSSGTGVLNARRCAIAIALVGLFVALPNVHLRAEAQSDGSGPFGVQIAGSRPSEVAAAVDLGASLIRKRIFLDEWNGRCWHCEPFQDAGLGIVLTVRTTAGDPSGPPSDMAAYKATLADVLEEIRPVALAVGNEQDADVFYSGTTAQYLDELEAACAVAEPLGIPCTDGGLTSHRVVAVVYQHYLDSGKRWRAKSFARRVAYSDLDYQRMVAPGNAERVKAFAKEGTAFLRGLKPAGADYVNFHWYRHDAKAFDEAVTVLQQIAGLSAVTNEIGQHVTDPQVISEHMMKVEELGLAFAVWYSIDQVVRYPEPMMIWALHDPAGELRPHGLEYRRIASGI